MIREVQTARDTRRHQNPDARRLDPDHHSAPAESVAVIGHPEHFVDPSAREFSDQIVLDNEIPPRLVREFEESVPHDRREMIAQNRLGKRGEADAAIVVNQDRLVGNGFG
jgi:hypothetical protein